MSNKIKILLIVSVLLNFLLIGITIGYVGKERLHKPVAKKHFPEIFELSPEKQEIVKKKMRQLRKETKPTRKKIRSVKAELREILVGEEFDENLYNNKVDELHELHGKMAKSLAVAIREIAPNFTPEEREILAKLLKKKDGRHHKKGPHHFREKPPH